MARKKVTNFNKRLRSDEFSSNSAETPKKKKTSDQKPPSPQQTSSLISPNQFNHLIEAFENTCGSIRAKNNQSHNTVQSHEKASGDNSEQDTLRMECNNLKSILLNTLKSHIQPAKLFSFEEITRFLQPLENDSNIEIERMERKKEHSLKDMNISIHVLSYLSFFDFLKVAPTCKTWYTCLREKCHEIVHEISISDTTSEMNLWQLLLRYFGENSRTTSKVRVIRIEHFISLNLIRFLGNHFGDSVTKLKMSNTIFHEIICDIEHPNNFDYSLFLSSCFPRVESLSMDSFFNHVFASLRAFPKLKALSLRENSFESRDEKFAEITSLENLSKIPKLKALKLYNPPSEVFGIAIHLFSPYLESFKIINLCGVLETHPINFGASKKYTLSQVISDISFPKLKKLTITIADDTSSQSSIVEDILLKLNHLETLKLQILNFEQKEDLLTKVIINNPNLKSLELLDHITLHTIELANAIRDLKYIQRIVIMSATPLFFKIITETSSPIQYLKCRYLNDQTFIGNSMLSSYGIHRLGSTLTVLSLMAEKEMDLNFCKHLKELYIYSYQSFFSCQIKSDTIEYLNTVKAEIHHLRILCPNLIELECCGELNTIDVQSLKLSHFNHERIHGLHRMRLIAPWINYLSLEEHLHHNGNQIFVYAPILQTLKCDKLFIINQKFQKLFPHIKTLTLQHDVCLNNQLIESLNRYSFLNRLEITCGLTTPSSSEQQLSETKQNNTIKEFITREEMDEPLDIKILANAFPYLHSIVLHGIQDVESFAQVLLESKLKNTLKNLSLSAVDDTEAHFASFFKSAKHLKSLRSLKLLCLDQGQELFHMDIELPQLEHFSTNISIESINQMNHLKHISFCIVKQNFSISTDEDLESLLSLFGDKEKKSNEKLPCLKVLDLRVVFMQKDVLYSFFKYFTRKFPHCTFISIVITKDCGDIFDISETLRKSYPQTHIPIQFDELAEELTL